MAKVREFLRIVVRLPAEDAGRVSAEAFEAGAVGLEERDDVEPGFIALDLYTAPARSDALLRAIRTVLPKTGRIEGPAPVAPVDWTTEWQKGLTATRIADRLLVRPPFVPSPRGAPAAELIIAPGQAFGTGAHASTRLALEWIAELELDGARVLDVGTGSGVLALAALRLGAQDAVGLDLDPLAAPAAWANARENGLTDRLRLFTGPLEALRARGFDLVLANLLRSELEPLVPRLAALLAPTGRAVFSGLLVSELGRFEALLECHGLSAQATREREEGGDAWTALLTRPGRTTPH